MEREKTKNNIKSNCRGRADHPVKNGAHNMLSVDYKQAIKEMSEQEFNEFCKFAYYSQLKERLEREKKDVRFGIQDNIQHALCDCYDNDTAYERLCERIYLAIGVAVGHDRVLSYIKK